MNILYVHGFGSRFDKKSSKIEALSEIGSVYGIDIDFTNPVDVWIKDVVKEISDKTIDLIVGTSLGGWTAAKVGSIVGIPFVALNPSIEPHESLKKYPKKGVTFYGKEYTIDDNTINSYHSIAKDGCGLVLLEAEDEVIDSKVTYELLKNTYEVHMFSGGSHRFESLKDHLQMIENFYYQSKLINGA